MHNTQNNSGSLSSSESKRSSLAGIQIAGILFVTVFTGILISNIVISNSLNEEATAINLAGRQRMLSQRLTKSINTLEKEVQTGNLEAAKKAQTEVKTSFNLFNDTLAAFRDGGTTKGATGDAVDLNPLPRGELKDYVIEASKIWEPMSGDILYVATDDVSKLEPTRINNSAQLLSENNLGLLKLMNQLTVGLEKQSTSKSSLLQYILFGALVLVFVNFAYIVLYAVRSLKRRDAQLKDYSQNLEKNFAELQETNDALEETQSELNNSNDSLQEALNSVQEISEQAQSRANDLEVLTLDLNRLKEESDTIFNAVDHGLCLLDEKFKIGKRVSRATYDIFETDHLANMSFLDLMRPLITEKDLKTLESYLKLQFNEKTLTSQLEKYNPLKKIEVTLNWDGDKFTNKHLGFEFERVMEDKNIVAVLITITDVTETVALENELKRAGEDQERKTNLILEIIQSDSQELSLFLSQTEKTLDKINDTLKEQGISDSSEGSSKELVEEVFRMVHNIKGNASMIGLETITEITHTVEDSLAALRNKDKVKGEEFLSSLVQLATLRERLNDYEEITHTILKDFATSASNKAPQSKKLTRSEKLAEEVHKFNNDIAKDLNKKVYSRCHLEMDAMSETGFSHIRDIIIQIARNAVVHGIETPDERKVKGKLEEGLFTVICEQDGSTTNILGKPAYKFTFRDDGAGLNLSYIKSKAVSMGLKTEEEAKAMSDAEVAGLIFEPAFTTVEEAHEHGGRGTGMDIIRDTIVNKLGGKLTMNFSPGSFMQLGCYIPKDVLESNLAAQKLA